jgi:hypothetical protein
MRFRSREAFPELAAARIMEPVRGADGNAEAEYHFTEDGWARLQLLLQVSSWCGRERFVIIRPLR